MSWLTAILALSREKDCHQQHFAFARLILMYEQCIASSYTTPQALACPVSVLCTANKRAGYYKVRYKLFSHSRMPYSGSSLINLDDSRATRRAMNAYVSLLALNLAFAAYQRQLPRVHIG
jgi:hypothetical protein